MDQPHIIQPSTFADRWEQLKSKIERLYLSEKMKLGDVVSTMKRDYQFDALEHQYKHQFKKWGWKKNISKAKKDAAAKQLESRARARKSDTIIKLYSRTIEPEKIRRYMKEKSRAECANMVLKASAPVDGVVTGSSPPLINSIFLKWNMPYAAMYQVHSRRDDHTGNAPSSNTVSVAKHGRIDRAHLFAQGQHETLLALMNGEERRIMSDWLYQYWFFCFKSAKTWGKGPTAWTAQLLDFARFQPNSDRSLPGTPHEFVAQSKQQDKERLVPTSLCRWYIHVQSSTWPKYEAVTDKYIVPDAAAQDPDDELTWVPWSDKQREPPLHIRLRDALEHNDFSSVPTSKLPIAIPQISKAAQRSPNELLLESLGFSIMSRNVDQVVTILGTLYNKRIDFPSLHPLHLATSYLDGYKACCDIVVVLLSASNYDPREMMTNELGHTILDNLMISILKSHSSTKPFTVDVALKDAVRFVGEEVDICGRWDADTPCVRQLFQNGDPCIPFAWKHKFCHGSIQTICHCITRLHDYGFLEDSTSGLYGRRCFNCGAKLELRPLHTLVMTAFHLANHACEDEDLFGVLACLLCMISLGFDPKRTALISVSAFMNDPMDIECDHEELSPATLAERITGCLIVSFWNEKLTVGWTVFCGVLRLCEDYYLDLGNSDIEQNYNHSRSEYAESNSENEGRAIDSQNHRKTPYERYLDRITDPCGSFLDEHRSCVICFRNRKDLATLWASVQAELLTYRRLETDHSWISARFSMENLKHQLSQGDLLSVEFAEQDLLANHCACGHFNCHPLATVSDVTAPELSNLDVWARGTYAVFPEE